MMQVVLASKSPRRLELLRMLGLDVIQSVSDVDESKVSANSPVELVEKLSLLKAEAVRGSMGDALPIIAADTVVEYDGNILGKPKSPENAKEMLRTLSGRTHNVHTGLTIIYGGKTVTDAVSAKVTFRELSDAEIDAYVASGDPMDKAGAYGIQCFAGCFVKGIEGDYFSIVGLPVCRVSEILASLGVPII